MRKAKYFNIILSVLFAICPSCLIFFLWHKTAWGYHLTNLLLHIIDTVLVFFLCKLLFMKYQLFQNIIEASLLTALLFFAYPMHSEAIFWILGRSATLGLLFFLLSILFYLSREQRLHFILSLFFALIAWLTLMNQHGYCSYSFSSFLSLTIRSNQFLQKKKLLFFLLSYPCLFSI